MNEQPLAPRRGENGVTARGDGERERARERALTRPGAPGNAALGEVVRDAMGQATEIVRDTVALGKLEARRMVVEGKHEARRALGRAGGVVKDVAPRAVFGLGAAMLGFVGVVLGLIAAFIGLGALVPSVAARLALFAAFFFIAAAGFAILAARPFAVLPHRDDRDEGPTGEARHEDEERPLPEHHAEKHASSINPVGHVGE